MIKILDRGEFISSEDIEKFEQYFNVVIPEPYRTFLLINNGGRPEPDIINIEGIYGTETDIAWFVSIRDNEESNTMDSNITTLSEGYPHKSIIPIACDSGGGIFCIDLEEGKHFPIVYFEWGGALKDTPYEPLYVASNFNVFLNMIHD